MEDIGGMKKKLKATLLTKKPKRYAKEVVLGTLTFIFLVSLLNWQPEFARRDLLAVIPQRILQEGEIWRVFTAILIHADLGHFLSNALLLGIFGYFIYSFFGLWVFPFGCFIAGGIINFISALTYNPQIHLLGASGVVFFMVAFWLTMYFFLQRQLSLQKRILNTLAISLILMIPESFKVEVSYRTHAIGFFLGLILGAAYFMINKIKIRSHEVWEFEVDDE